MAGYGSHTSITSAPGYGSSAELLPVPPQPALAASLSSSYGAAPVATPLASASSVTSSSSTYGSHVQMAVESVNEAASVSCVISSSGYGSSHTAAVAAACSPLPVGAVLQQQQQRHASHSTRRAWEEQYVFDWSQMQLICAAQTVHSAVHDSNAAPPVPAPSASPSYLWRSARWSYLCSYPSTPWNELYQRLFESVPSSPYEEALKASQQAELLRAFCAHSRNVVELLMEEAHLPPHDAQMEEEFQRDLARATSLGLPPPPPHQRSKFLSPLSVGGIAGGEKFLLNHTLFKFARDWAGLFRDGDDHDGGGGSGAGDEAVQKSAANEIRHMNAILEHEAPLLLHAPLSLTMTCLIRVRGSVVMCTALAPVQGERSMVYGSSDAGSTILDGSADPRAQAVVAHLGQAWHLAPHPVSDSLGQVHHLPLACDVELHSSRVDGRLYMLDLARFLPPSPPASGSMEHLWALMRPEWMRAQAQSPLPDSEPLSADTFSGFGRLDDALQSEKIRRSWTRMRLKTMPQVAQDLEQWWQLYCSDAASVHRLGQPVPPASDADADTDEDDAQSNSSAPGKSMTLSSCIARIVHAQGVNIRSLALVRSCLPSLTDADADADTSFSASPFFPAIPSLRTLLLYDMLSRTLKRVYFAWIRRMMLTVGHAQAGDSGAGAGGAPGSGSSPSSSSSSGMLGWTDADLERWMRRAQGERESDEGGAVPTAASSSHHESALLFARLLSLLFSSSPSPPSPDSAVTPDDSFFSTIVWPSLHAKFFNNKGGSEESATRAMSLHQWGQMLSEQERVDFQRACTSITAITTDTAAHAGSIPVFLRMMMEAVGLDWPALRHALQRLNVPVRTPVEYVRQLVPAVSQLSRDDGALQLTPRHVALLFLPSFEPMLKRVRCLPFLPLAQAEAQLRASLSARSAGLAYNASAAEPALSPALLGTLWALVALYEVHREGGQDMSAAAAVSPCPAPLVPSSPSADAPKSVGSSCYEKGLSVLSQIESIYTRLLADPSPESQALAATHVQWGRFGWFFLRFGHLRRAKEYFQREHQLRVSQVRRIEAALSTPNDGAPSAPHAHALLLLARSLESLGIISRECGEGDASLRHFESCLGVYQRLYGREGLHIVDEDEAKQEPEACVVDPPGEEYGTAPSDETSSAAAAFRCSLELSTLYTNLANCYGSVGQPVRKRRCLERALAIVRARFGADSSVPGMESRAPHPSLLSILNNLSTCYTHPTATAEELEKARTMLEECVGWNRAMHRTCKRSSSSTASPVPPAAEQSSLTEFDDEHVSAAPLFTNLANVYGRLGHPARKVRLLERALLLSEKQHGSAAATAGSSGPASAESAVIMTNLGMAYGTQAASLGAGPVSQRLLLRGLHTLQQALGIKTRLYGSPVHNEVALTLSNMAVLYAQAGDLKQELRSLTQAMQIYMAVLQKQAQVAKDAETARAVATATEGATSAAPGVASPPSTPAVPPSVPASPLVSNPALLFVQQRLSHCHQRMLALQSDMLTSCRCTFLATGTNRTAQSWFRCLTCCPPEGPNANSGLGVCLSCKSRCHEGHLLEEQDPASFYCDCGEGVFPAPCRAMEPVAQAAAVMPVPEHAEAMAQQGAEQPAA